MAKALVVLLFRLATLPWVAVYWMATAVAPGRRLSFFQGMSQWWSLWPGVTGQYLRRGFYQSTLVHCSPKTCIEFGTTFATPNVVMPDGVYVGAFCNVGDVIFGNDVLVGSGVMLLSGRRQHLFARLDIPIRMQGGVNDVITIGRDCWIGNGAIVMADVGEQSVVAAGAVVIAPVPPRSIVGGNPAKVIGTREQP